MSSHDMKNPDGGVSMGHVMEPPDPNEHLPERILSRENMLKAWKRVKANKGTAGVDKMSIADFPGYAHTHWDSIRESLSAGSYQPVPVRCVRIPKATGGTRPLGIPTVLDRLIQQAIYQVLMPVFDPDFSDHSYGFRPGRSAHDAVYQIREYIREGCRIAVDMDLSKFFDTVNHDVLMHRVARKVRDKRVLRLIGKYLRAGVMRMCYWKQWRYARTKVRELRKLGTSLHAAISAAISRKGPWHLARTLAAQTGMTNQWLMDQGLLSVKELWVNIHYPATAR